MAAPTPPTDSTAPETMPPPDEGASGDASRDIRLLGTLIGDVLRDQTSDATFELVEGVRRIAVSGRRSGMAPIDELDARLGGAAIDDQVHLIRAFGWLSLLANTAEDLHNERRRRYYLDQGSASQPGSVAASLDKLLAQGVAAEKVADELRDLVVSPVITAHPTEVRRKTVLDHVDEVAMLLDRRAHADDSPSELAELDGALRREVLTLWQTAEVRLSKLRVRDEINEALRYYRSSIFRTVPELHADLAVLASERLGDDVRNDRAVSMGSWIGGDRDGNPFVTADVLKLAVESHAAEAFGHHLGAIFDLSRDLSMSARLITPTAALDALAERSQDDSPFRSDEPYRRALRGIHARMWATAAAVLPQPPGPRPHADLEPYEFAGDVVDDLNIVVDSLRSHGAGALADDLVEPVRRAVETFGTHLCGLDLRQNSAVHEVVVDELFRGAAVTADYLRLDETARVELLTAELRSPRRLATPDADYGETTQQELAILAEAASAHARFGPRYHPICVPRFLWLIRL